MKSYLSKLYVGVMLILAAMIIDANFTILAGDQIQTGGIVALVVSVLLLIAGIVLVVLSARQKKREAAGKKRKLDKVQITGIVTVCVAAVVNAVLRDFVFVNMGTGVAVVKGVVLCAIVALGVAMIVFGTRCKLFAKKED